jgi:hypothetical protein
MRRVIEQRGRAMSGVEPGADTGLLVRTLKTVGSGFDAKVVAEYEVDTGLLKELREHEKQAAQELGQWSDKSRIEQGPMQVRIVWSDQDAHP